MAAVPLHPCKRACKCACISSLLGALELAWVDHGPDEHTSAADASEVIVHVATEAERAHLVHHVGSYSDKRNNMAVY
eukprot:9166693-Pyramimonas_sp.AAC.1